MHSQRVLSEVHNNPVTVSKTPKRGINEVRGQKQDIEDEREPDLGTTFEGVNHD